jgi:hypothetical protein
MSIVVDDVAAASAAAAQLAVAQLALSYARCCPPLESLSAVVPGRRMSENWRMVGRPTHEWITSEMTKYNVSEQVVNAAYIGHVFCMQPSCAKREMPVNSGTSNIIDHFDRQHRIKLVTEKQTPEGESKSKKQKLQASAASPTQPSVLAFAANFKPFSATKNFKDNSMSKPALAACNNLAAEFFCENAIPMYVANSHSWRALLFHLSSNINSPYYAPGRKKMTQIQDEYFAHVDSTIKKSLPLDAYYAITGDACTLASGGTTTNFYIALT